MFRARFFGFSLLLLAWSGPILSADDTRPLTSGYTGGDAPFRAGMWWNEELEGSGMDMHLSGDRMFLVWYTYEADGTPVWYLAEQELEGDSWTAPLNRYTWDEATKEASPTEVGEVSVRFQGPTAATFEWQLGEESGSYPIEPLLVSEGISAYDRTGHWFPPGEPGYGITINTQGSVEFAVAYLYDDQGDPRWLWSQRTGEVPETLELVMFEGACPACEHVEPVPTAAGSLKREFEAPIAGLLTLDATFPEPLSGEWRRTEVPIRMLSNRPDGRAHPAAMAQFASDEALEAYLKRALAEGPPRPDSGGSRFSPPPPRVSRTTVQEAGVGEADSVKSDGRTLYTVSRSDGQSVVRILDLDPAAAVASEVAKIGLDDEGPPLRDLYLLQGDSERQSDLLVGLAYRDVVGDYLPTWMYPGSWLGETVEAHVWNVDKPAAPELVARIGLDGGLVESRRIGDTLYLVSRFTPEPPEGVIFRPTNDQEVEANLALLEDVPLEDLLPDIRIDGNTVGKLVDSAATWLPPVLLNEESPDLVSIAAIDLRAPEAEPNALTVVGPTEAIYVSPDNLYLASTRNEYLTDLGNMVLEYPRLTYTDIHMLGLEPEGPAYSGSASVEGHLGYLQDRKSYRMGEHQDMLGVVTSANSMWGTLGEHRLTMLQETPETPKHRLLREAVHLPSADRPKTLGKPGERLYATRFLGDRLYVVTFKKVDPLYVVDLADPAKPSITGEVELPGFSDFLHPVGEGYLVGVGLDTVPAEGSGDGRFAWFQGVRLGLFDVKDPGNPKEIDHVVVGRRGTKSPALFDPHAFSFLPRGNGLPARFALPVRMHDAWPQDNVADSPNHSYPWVRTGLFLFNVITGGGLEPQLRHRGTIVTAVRTDQNSDDPGARLDPDLARSVIMDDSVFFVKREGVWSTKWHAPVDAAGPQ